MQPFQMFSQVSYDMYCILHCDQSPLDPQPLTPLKPSSSSTTKDEQQHCSVFTSWLIGAFICGNLPLYFAEAVRAFEMAINIYTDMVGIIYFGIKISSVQLVITDSEHGNCSGLPYPYRSPTRTFLSIT